MKLVLLLFCLALACAGATKPADVAATTQDESMPSNSARDTPEDLADYDAHLPTVITPEARLVLAGTGDNVLSPADVSASRAALLTPASSISVATTINQAFRFCNLQTTSTVLGYYPYTNKKVYQNTCTGLCLSIITKPTECRAITTKTKVFKSPFGYFSRQVGGLFSVKPVTFYGEVEVDLVTGCECKPKRCTVTNQFGVDQTYESGATVIDACNRRCTCSYGKLINCCRQRKEFRVGLSHSEKLAYINAVKTVATTAPYKAQYDALIALHQTFFNGGIHNAPAFLPWHRWYILQLENLLQQVDCRVTASYWDWSKEAANPLGSTIWSNSYLGPNGSPSGSCVPSGPFGPGFSVTPSAGGGCLKRAFAPSATAATVADIQNTLNQYQYPNTGNFSQWAYYLEHGVGTHDHVHCIISGTMCTSSAANAPEFFLHHTHLDKLWADWQKQSPAHVSVYHGTASTAMPATGGVTPSQMFDLNDQLGERVCYITPSPWFWIDDLVLSLSTAVIRPTSPLVGDGSVSPLPLLNQLAVIPILPKHTNDEMFKNWIGMMTFTTAEKQQLLRELDAMQTLRNSGNLVPILPLEQLDPQLPEASLGVRITEELLDAALPPLRQEGCTNTDDVIDPRDEDQPDQCPKPTGQSVDLIAARDDL